MNIQNYLYFFILETNDLRVKLKDALYCSIKNLKLLGKVLQQLPCFWVKYPGQWPVFSNLPSFAVQRAQHSFPDRSINTVLVHITKASHADKYISSFKKTLPFFVNLFITFCSSLLVLLIPSDKNFRKFPGFHFRFSIVMLFPVSFL